MTDDPLRSLAHLAGGHPEGATLACETCGALSTAMTSEDYFPVDPGDLRHGSCWMKNFEAGRMVRRDN